jgi:hypothetical protein
MQMGIQVTPFFCFIDCPIKNFISFWGKNQEKKEKMPKSTIDVKNMG